MNATKKSNESGFTIVEVIIAIIVLSVGLLGLVSTAALVTRMIGRGGHLASAPRSSRPTSTTDFPTNDSDLAWIAGFAERSSGQVMSSASIAIPGGSPAAPLFSRNILGFFE